jgi:hypothetical protein
MYQPQLEAWNGDELRAYAALAAMSTTNKTTKYGVVWFTARTEVDKVNRQVTLDNFEITRVTFPMMKAREAEFQAFLQAKLPGRSKVIALDRLEAALAANDSEQAGVEAFPVNNEPPKVILRPNPRYSSSSTAHHSIKMSVEPTAVDAQHEPRFCSTPEKYYLNVMDGWLQAPDLIADPGPSLRRFPMI